MEKIHLIGNAHLDPVWLWRWQEGYAEVLATYRSALDRMKEFPDYKFTAGCAAYYEWVKEIDPDMFEEIKARVAEGRWCIVGGQYIQPDCNAPSGESFARQALYSQRFFLENFGKTASVGYNVDSFGHCGSLPQLLKNSGLKNYVFMRPQPNEKELPNTLFDWEGIDGTVLRTMRIREPYCVINMDGHLEAHIDKVNEEKNDLMLFYGIGNHGGGPTIRLLNQVENKKTMYDGKLLYSTPNEYFEAVKDISVPHLKDELQHHARGCYSVVSKLKEKLRKSEFALENAEKLCSSVHMLFGDKYPSEDLTLAWKNVLFNQFHDVAGGCCIESAVNDAAEQYDESLSIAARQSNRALQKLAWNIDTSNGLDLVASRDRGWQLWETEQLGTPVIVYNPLSWAVSQPIKCGTVVKSVTDNDGNEVPSQIVRNERTNGADKNQTMFMADIPAMGYRVYRIYSTKESEITSNKLKNGVNYIENEFIRVYIDEITGCILSIYDKVNSRNVFAPISSSADVIDMTHCDTWAHNIPAFDKKLGEFGSAKISVLETGPVRSVIRSVAYYGKSTLTQDFILYAGKPQIDVEACVDWQEKCSVLKLKFNTALKSPKVTADIPYGFISRTANGEEEHCHKWVDLSDSDYGVAFMNDSKYSYSADGTSFSLTAVNNAVYADHYGQNHRDQYCRFTDLGEAKFKYSVLPHSGSFKDAGVIRKAYELNCPATHIVGTFHKGTLPCEAEFINISSENIIAEALKISEDGNAYILRCFEIKGESTSAEIILSHIDRKISAVFTPHEVKTFYIPFEKSADIKETNFLEL